MKDKELEAFVVAIERHFSAKRGKQHLLSPRDFALARGWHAAGLPLATVLAGVDRVLARERDVVSLRYCRRSIEALASAASPAEVESTSDLAPEEIAARLEALHSAMTALAQPALFERSGRRLAELLDLVAVAREPNWDYLRSKLEELDRLVDVAAVAALRPAERARLSDAAAVARERLGLPRVSVD